MRSPAFQHTKASERAQIRFVRSDDQAIGPLARGLPLLHRRAARGANESSRLTGNGRGFGAPVLRAALTSNIEHSHLATMPSPPPETSRLAVRTKKKDRFADRSPSHLDHNDWHLRILRGVAPPRRSIAFHGALERRLQDIRPWPRRDRVGLVAHRVRTINDAVNARLGGRNTAELIALQDDDGRPPSTITAATSSSAMQTASAAP
jgi:hypothetical protein